MAIAAMQSATRCLIWRRLYSDWPAGVNPAQVARIRSSPLAVRRRREKQLGSGQVDVTSSGISISERTRYLRLRALGKIPKINGQEMTDKEWMDKQNQRRSRIRGFKTVEQDGKSLTKVLGRRVYLPNYIIKLVRNHTLPGHPYNPYEATFRIPKSMTKTDLRSYLLAIYGVSTTYIRTDTYNAPLPTRARRDVDTSKNYKRAVAGLVDPFYYPHRLEDMKPQEREEREKKMEGYFMMKLALEIKRAAALRISKGGNRASWSVNPETVFRRSHILQRISEKRGQREGRIAAVVEEIQEKRAKGEQVALKDIAKPQLASKEVESP